MSKKSIPANYYEPDYNGPGCAIVMVLGLGALVIMGLFLLLLFSLFS